MSLPKTINTTTGTENEEKILVETPIVNINPLQTVKTTTGAENKGK